MSEIFGASGVERRRYLAFESLCRCFGYGFSGRFHCLLGIATLSRLGQHGGYSVPLKMGLLVIDPGRVDRHIFDFVSWARTQPDIEIEICRVTRGSTSLGIPPSGSAPSASIAARAAFKFIRMMESALVRRDPVYRDYLQSWSIADVAPVSVTITSEPSPHTSVYRFFPEQVGKVKARGYDVLLQAGVGILRGEILTACRLGVISIHHGDNTEFRGWPAGFWEVYHRRSRTGFIIQRLTEDLDGGDVLARGWFATRRTFLRNMVSVYLKTTPHLCRLVRRIADTGRLPPAEPSAPYSSMMYAAPTFWQSVAYLARFGASIIGEAWHRMRKNRMRWGVAFVRADWRNASLTKGRALPVDAGRFVADPFVAERNGQCVCFVEDFSYAEGRGVISAYSVNGADALRLGPVIEDAAHLSFPFTFEHGGELYMCPETLTEREIRLYRCADFPMRWERCATLMRDVAAVDTMLFERGGKWWLLTTMDTSERGDFSTDLHLFYADSPLAVTWTPHPLNPVCVDSDKGRNGGLLVDGASVFRVGQKQGTVYGERASIFEITELTETGYSERLVSHVEPAFARGVIGCHHFSAGPSVTVFDYCRRTRVDAPIKSGGI